MCFDVGSLGELKSVRANIVLQLESSLETSEEPASLPLSHEVDTFQLRLRDEKNSESGPLSGVN